MIKQKRLTEDQVTGVARALRPDVETREFAWKCSISKVMQSSGIGMLSSALEP